jgi:hypothetical protein
LDNYPDHLGIELDMGSIAIPFMDWWSQTRTYFPHVPENVAEQWLHRHWNGSPFGYLKSANYRFELQDFASSQLSEVLSFQSFFAPNVADRIAAGRKWAEAADDWQWGLPKAMVRYRDFPAPIIILDNSDGHLSRDEANAREEKIPRGLILIEGHQRLDIASYLISENRFRATVKVWVMNRRRKRKKRHLDATAPRPDASTDTA